MVLLSLLFHTHIRRGKVSVCICSGPRTTYTLPRDDSVQSSRPVSTTAAACASNHVGSHQPCICRHSCSQLLLHWLSFPCCDTWSAYARQVSCAATPRQQSTNATSLSHFLPSLLLYGLGTSVAWSEIVGRSHAGSTDPWTASYSTVHVSGMSSTTSTLSNMQGAFTS